MSDTNTLTSPNSTPLPGKSVFDSSFLELPLDSLLATDISTMSETELRHHLSTLRELITIPATRTAALREESEIIKTRKPRAQKASIRQMLDEI